MSEEAKELFIIYAFVLGVAIGCIAMLGIGNLFKFFFGCPA